MGFGLCEDIRTFEAAINADMAEPSSSNFGRCDLLEETPRRKIWIKKLEICSHRKKSSVSS